MKLMPAFIVIIVISVSFSSWCLGEELPDLSQFDYDSYQPIDPEALWKKTPVFEDSDFTIETRQVKYRIDVPYTGKQRKLIEERKVLFQIWAKTLGQPADFADLCSQEIEIEVGSTEYWIPIQDSLLEPFAVEVKKGSRLRLWVSYIGNENKKQVYSINSYQVIPGDHIALPTAPSSEKTNSLYGFTLGKQISEVMDKLGDPDQLIDLEDGSIARAYISESHYAVFVSIPPNNDFIYSIQVSGERTTPEQSYRGIQLGDSFEKVMEILGQPTLSRAAKDRLTNEEVEATSLHSFGDYCSFEEVDGKVSSIKITFDGVLSSDDPDENEIFANLPIEFQKVREHILNNDYPELFGDEHYRIAANDMKVIDFGKDGLMEVVVLYKPHYLQSPTIVIFQIQNDGSVKRIMEALAPGPLVKRGDYFLDSHSLGEGVDFTFGDKPLPPEEGRKKIMMAMEKVGSGHLVQYRDFIHMDTRSGAVSYIDMTHHKPFSDSQDCSEFEFSQVDAITVGYKEGDTKIGLITAIVGEKTYVYEISSISADGFLEKKLSVEDRE